MEKVIRISSANGVMMFSKSQCCMCYSVKILFNELGVNLMVHELDHDPEGKEMEMELMRMGCSSPVPAVFIGGNLVGSTNEVMALHLSAGLVPLIWPYRFLH